MMRFRSVVPGVLAALTVLGAGAAAALDPRFLAVVALLAVLLIAVMFPNGRWQLAPLLVIVISPAIFVDGAGEPLPNGDAVQKAMLLLALMCLAITAGVRWSAIGGAAVAAIGLAGLVSFLNLGGAIEVSAPLAMRALIGYALPWLFLFIDWRRVGLVRGLRFLGTLPLWSIGAGVVLQIAGVTTVLRIDEDSGVPRLQGASIPAHLAMLSVVALFAGLCLLSMRGHGGGRRGYVWVSLNLVILIGTATRGALVVGVVLVLAFVVHALLVNRRISRRARNAALLLSLIGSGALAFAAPELIRRSMGNSYEGTFNTSGRDQAWEFFSGLASQNLYTGRGLGFSTIAVEMYAPPNVQKQFVAPHNEYIHLTLDGGIFLVIALFAAMAAAIYFAARAQRGTVRFVVIGLGAALIAWSAIDNTFSTPQFTVLILIALGLLAAHPVPTRRAPQPDGERVLEPAGAP